MEIKIKRLLLILSFTLGLTTAANANDKPFAVGDVFFCETLKSVGWVWEGEPQFQNYRPERFKFSIVDKFTIRFGSNGYFEDYEMPIDTRIGQLLKAKAPLANLLLYKNKLNYTTNSISETTVLVATCDRF